MVELKIRNGTTRDGEQIKSLVQSFYKNLYERGDTSDAKYDDFFLNMDKISSENKHNILTPLNIQELLPPSGRVRIQPPAWIGFCTLSYDLHG